MKYAVIINGTWCYNEIYLSALKPIQIIRERKRLSAKHDIDYPNIKLICTIQHPPQNHGSRWIERDGKKILSNINI